MKRLKFCNPRSDIIRTLVSDIYYDIIKKYDFYIENHKELTLIGHTKQIILIYPLPENKIITSSRDNTLQIWNTLTGICEAMLMGVCIMCITHIGDELIAGDNKGSIHTLNLQLKYTKSIKAHDFCVTTVAVAPGHVITTSRNQIKVWDLSLNQITISNYYCSGNINSIAIFRESPIFGTYGGSIKMGYKVLRGYSWSIRKLLILCDMIIVVSDNGIQIWKHEQIIRTIRFPRLLKAYDACVLPDDRLMCCFIDEIRIYTLNEIVKHTSIKKCVYKLVCLPDGRLATCSDTNAVEIWR